jgi:hypothetical protein
MGGRGMTETVLWFGGLALLVVFIASHFLE